jgi:hypothetical protein
MTLQGIGQLRDQSQPLQDRVELYLQITVDLLDHLNRYRAPHEVAAKTPPLSGNAYATMDTLVNIGRTLITTMQNAEAADCCQQSAAENGKTPI